MTIATISPRVRWVPAITGFALLIAATALLLEDQFRSGHWDVAHLAVPILTGATCVAGVLAHHAFARWQLLSGTALAMLALLGSALCILNTLSRTATARDDAEATVSAANRTYGEKSAALEAAKTSAKVECKSIGPKCQQWQKRVDTLTAELSGIVVKSTDPQADALVRIAVLVGFDGNRTRAIVVALQPAALPIFLEFGAIVLLGIAFPCRRGAVVHQLQTPAPSEPATVVQSFTREAALADLRRMRSAGSGKVLAERWGVHPTTAGRWLSEWQGNGAIERQRDGKAMKAIAAPR